VKHGYRGPIYSTPATALLGDIMLRDSAHIQEKDTEYANKKHFRRGQLPVEPLYSLADAEEVNQHFQPMPYDQTFEPVEGVTAHLVDAGHILGSAAIVLDVKENGRKYRLWFSGDIGRNNLPLLRDPVLPEGADYLMMESTYGDKPHGDPQVAYEEFRDVVVRTIQRGGKVIIPAFAVGRTQEIVYSLNRMFNDGEIKPVPVFVDSPLAVHASQVFRDHPEYFDEETQKFILSGKHPALDFPQLTYVQSVEESKALNDRHEPMIIISASGMAEAGRILHHLRNNIEDARNTIMIVGWQAPNTLGRRLADRETKVRIFGEYYLRQAEVVTIGGLSAHAGQELLVRYANNVKDSVKKVIIVHGEPTPAGALMDLMKTSISAPLAYPELGDVVEL
jgi:metallo-beta-lactamase family protein